jgi:hypothetical protein
MNLDSPTPNISEPFSLEVIEKLKELEKKRKLVENRMLLWLTIPVFWIITGILFAVFQSGAMLIITVISWVGAPIGLGIYLHVILPSNEEISNAYKKAVIPDLIRIAGGEGDYSLSHGLKVDSFLKSGLYHENYSHFERADSIIGKYKNIKFGLYELAVQSGKTLGGQMSMGTGIMLPSSSVLTNMFYGWVLHVPIRALAGSTYIIPARAKAKGESDEWIKPTFEYFAKQFSVQVFKSGNANFDSAFYVYTTNSSEAEKILQPAFREFLMLVLSQSANAPGFSFVGNRAYMHLGISDTAFDRQTGSKIYLPDTDRLMKKIRFSLAMTAALHAAANEK